MSVFLDAWNGAVYPTHSSTVEVEVRMRRASDDEYRWTLCHVTPSFDSQNRAEMVRKIVKGKEVRWLLIYTYIYVIMLAFGYLDGHSRSKGCTSRATQKGGD